MRSVAALALCCLASEVGAQEIPDFDTEAFCERRAGPNTLENRRFASCLWIEEIGLAELEDHWPEADETTRLDCIEEANPRESYAVLASCIMHRVRQQRRR
jgi:hypothetical protein